MPDLVLLRHGQSTWNERNLFTGWQDVDLSGHGEAEAKQAGELLRAATDMDIRTVHTSVLVRSIRTAEIALHAAGRSWIPVVRDWRLNERHYGDLTGKDKKATAAEFGLDQVQQWRRSYDIPPPPLPKGDERRSDDDPRYASLSPKKIPATECLKDVVARVEPYLRGVLTPALEHAAHRGSAVIVVAHGNSLRALRMLLEDIDRRTITELEIPTGIPFRYRLSKKLRVKSAAYLGDAAAAASAAAAVAKQAG